MHLAVRLPRIAILAATVVLAVLVWLVATRAPGASTNTGAEILKDPSSANLFIGAGPLTINERVYNIPANRPLTSFTLRIRYDPELVAIEVAEGPFLASTQRITSCGGTDVWGEINYSCTSSGTQAGPTGSGILVTLTIRPAAGIKFRASQQNGFVMQLDDVLEGTRLFTASPSLIPLVNLGDAKIIVRALEGDVNGDCVVDIRDGDLLRVRVGARKGSLLYETRYDLQPASAPDNQISVKDWAFVKGRIGSTCEHPHPNQPSPTPLPTRTPKPTATIRLGTTATPVKGPPMKKAPSLVNLWLTRQGTKIPPSQCAGPSGTTDVAVLSEEINEPITSPDQIVGGFQVEILYDAKRVCIEIQRGSAADEDMVCSIQDSITEPSLHGIARIICAPLGKDVSGPNSKDPAGRQLALILVHPQPEPYSQINPANGNGMVVQILNTNCNLTDLQGNPYTPNVCDDAEVTIRYLEGDVEPDCVIDGLDSQAIAFRLGAQKGSLLYLQRMDMVPIQSNGIIDVNDVQFVYGRLGSTCDSPHPPQPPVNPKE